jgi:hypothetical protein
VLAGVAHWKDWKVQQLMDLLMALLNWWLQKEHYPVLVEWQHQRLVSAEDQEWKVDHCLE